MVTRQFCSAPGQTQSLAGCNNSNGENASACRRMSLASRAGALVRQLSSRANLTDEAQPLRGGGARANSSPPSAKMALFHTRTATVHVENGEWSLALKSYNRALIHHRQLHGQDSAQCATTLAAIGVCLMNLATGGPDQSAGGPDEESRLCREYVRCAECALREALYIRERMFGTDSDEVEEVEINMELLLGPEWNVQQHAAGASRTRSASNPSNAPSRSSSSSTDSLSGNNFQRAARRLFGSGGNGENDAAAKRKHGSRNQLSANDTASSSSSSSSSSFLSSQEEQIDFQYPSSSSMAKTSSQSFVGVDLAKDEGVISTLPLTSSSSVPCSSSSSSSNKSLASSSHSTGSFGRNDGDGEDEDLDDVTVDEIELWTLDDISGDEMEQRRISPPRSSLANNGRSLCTGIGRSKERGGGGAGRPSPTHACNVLFASAK